MNIKDPAFISHRDKNNVYNFGKIALSVLVNRCKNSGQNDGVCASESLTLETPSYVGIPSANVTVDTSLFQTRECRKI